MYCETFSLRILHMLSEHWIRRVMSIDIETKVVGAFLQDERILGVGLATRTSGELTSADGIEFKSFVLETDDDVSETQLLQAVDKCLGEYRPLALIGYRHRGYDVPLLCAKLQKYRAPLKPPLWKLIDALEQAAHVDLYFILKSNYGIRTLAEAVRAPQFDHLPLLRQKGLVSSDFDQKGKEIYRLWEHDRPSFKEYMKGDVTDPLLIAEALLQELKQS